MKRILIIEDDVVTREVLLETLEPCGYELSQAENGKEGLKLCRKKPFDLVITDIIMPEMEGLETITALKNSRPGAPVIAISGGGRGRAGEYLTMAEHLGVEADRVNVKATTNEGRGAVGRREIVACQARSLMSSV